MGREEYIIDIYEHIGAMFLLDSKNMPEIIDFFSCPAEFFNQLEEIDVMIVCSRSLKGWPGEEALSENLEQMFRKRRIKFSIDNNTESLYFDGKEIVIPSFFNFKLSQTKELFKLEHVVNWYLDPHRLPTVFYIYKRNELLQDS